jgi:hypothetical protein
MSMVAPVAGALHRQGQHAINQSTQVASTPRHVHVTVAAARATILPDLCMTNHVANLHGVLYVLLHDCA